MRRPKLAIGVLALLCTSANGASESDIDKLTTYAVMLGRGTACGADVESASRKVGRWMDQRFPPGIRRSANLPSHFHGGYEASRRAAGVR